MPNIQKSFGTTGQVDWLTPKWFINALGPFDLDPCASLNRKWDNGKVNLTIKEDGLKTSWKGFVWMKKLANHKDGGIALVFIRSDTEWFQSYVSKCSAMILLSKRIIFIDGTAGRFAGTPSAPSVLIGFGAEAKKRLFNCQLKGILVTPIDRNLE